MRKLSKKKRMSKFRQQEWLRLRRVGKKWRRPRGKDSKMRVGKRGKPAMPSVGYKLPETSRGLHPSGLVEVAVSRPNDVEGINPSRQAVRIASSVGIRKREQILARAKELGIRVLNPGIKKRVVKKLETEVTEKAGG
jgi:large subunit ribosomal protein L32e